MGKEAPVLLYKPKFSHRKEKKKTNQQPRISEVEISKGDIPTETHSSFLAGFTTNQYAVTPQPCKYWHICLVSQRMKICVLKEVTLRHIIKHIQKSEQDQKPEQLHPGTRLGPDFIIFTSIY